jgi:hypothetical protein
MYTIVDGVQDCIEAFNRGEPVCGSSLELLRTTVATLISISGAHRSRIHHQYQTYRALAHDLRARLYARSHGTNSHSSSHRGSMYAQHSGTWGVGSPNGQPTAASRSSGALDRGDEGLGRTLWKMFSDSLASSFGRGPAATAIGAVQRVPAEHGHSEGAIHVSLF